MLQLQCCKLETFDKYHDVSFPVTGYIRFSKLHSKFFFVPAAASNKRFISSVKGT